MDPHERIFVGTFLITTDNFLLQPPNPSNFIDVSPEPDLALSLDQRFDREFVSILGHMAERPLSGSQKVATLITKKIALRKDIELRAFEIFRSREGGSALANWLRAERELLGLPA
jgi:hypothetical protein